ncbi:TOM1-like protein 1 isoform X2 [Sphaerodactylus townsendi]|nr:TOM1-like protein 1 isoform X2 [Sphaerodactylus townsendi]
MCMQNCGPSFQSLVVKREFCKDRLVKLLNPRFNLPVDMQEKILTFIMTWARGFQGAVDVTEVKEVYLELLKKGVEFPTCGIQKPLSQTSTKASLSHRTAKNGLADSLPAGTTITLIPEQIGKLYSELDMAKMNVRVMSAILKENVPGSENPDDMKLLQKLYKTCRVMQERIMELLATVQNEDVITELIQVNENLNNVLMGHERFSRNRVRFLENQRIQNERTLVNGNQPSAPSSDLLDLESSVPATVPKAEGAGLAASPFSESNCRPPSIAAPPTHLMQPSLYPQLNALHANTVQATFVTEAQSTNQSFPVASQYENVNSFLNPVPLHPVSLRINGTRDMPATDGSKSQVSPPNYYELMEFDPLAPSDKNEPIYEEIDAHLFRPSVKTPTSC